MVQFKHIIATIVLVHLGQGYAQETQTGCGVDSKGVLRKPGDSWRQSCNRCRCLTNGVPGCTKRFCGPVAAVVVSKECKDQEGGSREEGEQWVTEDGKEGCKCNAGVVQCNTLEVVTDLRGDIGCGGREPGFEWTNDGCNTCSCVHGVAVCTEKFCPTSLPCTLKNGTVVPPGYSYPHSDGCNKCSCFSGSFTCTETGCPRPRPSAGISFPGATGQPGRSDGGCEDSNGKVRGRGEAWKEDCNTCRCTSSGKSVCTLRFCSPAVPAPPTCSDKEGNVRKSGQSWKDDCNTCRCTTTGRTICTLALCSTSSSSSPLSPSSSSSSCTDSQGITRGTGEAWKDDCNSCRCTSLGVSVCTLVLCSSSSSSSSRTDPALFSLTPSTDISTSPLCTQPGVTNCRSVSLNPSLLSTRDSIQTGASFLLTPDSSVSLTLKRSPTKTTTSTSFVFSTSDHGEAVVTARTIPDNPSLASVFASIKPLTGGVHYFVESCGDGCNVMYERSADFFNQFED